ncbi:MAG: hypothetical protein A2Z18_05790 [Armatimonadetes bacterium RBG_16_58_9]|nr:MAG: hypothetical protein A2Z18_05790 [Armatimonadetes bacterium RBG_16_58_9]
MPANLTPDYLAAEKRFREAETTEDKLAALEEMYATIPKHKGTEKLQADIRRRTSKLRDKEKQLTRKGKRHDDFHVIKQGAGQVVLVGPPNSGKSSIVDRLTAAEPEIADYPFTTRRPLPAMADFEDVSIQLVDSPAMAGEHTERGVIGLARNADAVALVLDASNDAIIDHVEDVMGEFSKSRTAIVGELAESRDFPPGIVVKPGFVIANKIDKQGASANLEVLRELYANEFVIHTTSAETGEGLEELRRRFFESLGIIRVYTKIPGKPPDRDKPFTVKRGSTLIDFAAAVHKDFAAGLRFAKAWGARVLPGAQIGRDHVLEDGDVVELHA